MSNKVKTVEKSFKEMLVETPTSTAHMRTFKRSIYQKQLRNHQDDIMGIFAIFPYTAFMQVSNFRRVNKVGWNRL